MTFLENERATLEEFLPGLDAKLEHLPLRLMESPGSPAVQLFREHGGPALTVSQEYGGKGANVLQIARIHRAIASRSPSLAIAANMHACTVAAIPPCPATAELLQGIARQNLYLASGFADGQVMAGGIGAFFVRLASESADDTNPDERLVHASVDLRAILTD